MHHNVPNVLIIGAGMYVCGRGTDGCGTILPTVLQERKNGNVGEIWVAATSPKSIKELRAKALKLKKMMNVDTKIKTFPAGIRSNTESYKEALKNIPKPACCIVSVPDHLHEKVTKDVIEAGLHVLVVKPFTVNLKEAVSLCNAAKKKGIYGCVEFHKRYDDANLKIKDTLSEGKIGDPLYFSVEYSQKKMIPEKIFKRWASKTNIFQYLGVHYVDMIHFATGARPVRVMALGQKNWLKSRNIDSYDAVECMIEWKNGKSKFVSTILTNWIDPNTASAMSDQKIKVIGTKGRIESDQKNRGFSMVTDTEGIEDVNPYFSQYYSDGTGTKEIKGYGPRSISIFIKDVSDICDNKIKLTSLEKIRPVFKSALVSAAVIDAANRSLSSDGKWVKVDKF